ncbi:MULTISPECIES: glycosyltransferase [Cupriavidus]
MKDNGLYVFLDPFNSESSGVTAYIREAQCALNRLGHATRVVAIRHREEIEEFRKRSAYTVANAGKIRLVEAPESLASSAGIPDSCPLHIRLHLSRQVGKILQMQKADSRSIALEQREIARAAYLSAPSESAVALSRVAFRIRRDVAVYGNPVPEFCWRDTKKEFQALFIGRWQALKGIHFLNEAGRHLGSKRIAVITDRDLPSCLPPGLVRIAVDSRAEKMNRIRQSRCVVVPSLFETASMVGIEAISLGVPVVAWSHLGLAEYAGAPLVVAVEPFDTEKLTAAVADVEDTADQDAWRLRIREINRGFADAMAGMLGGEVVAGRFGLCEARNTSWIDIVLENGSHVMTDSGQGVIARKFRKLRRDPMAFLRDSRLAELFHSPGSTPAKVEVKAQSVVISPARKIPAAQPATRAGGSAGQATPPKIPVAPAEGRKDLSASHQDQEEAVSHPVFADIKAGERITFGGVEGKRIGWRVGFFYSEPDRVMALDLIERLAEFTDFRPLSRECLYVGRFEVSDEETVFSLINRIDVANKGRISSLDHILILNGPASLQSAFRACGPSQRVIAIDTRGSGRSHAAPEVDVLISNCISAERPDDGSLRKEISLVDKRMLAGTIRRAVQEGGPKSIDVLIPIREGKEFYPDYLDFDGKKYQGIIFLKSEVEYKSKSLADFCTMLSASVKSMLVLDSVYCRYRTMCEDIERGGNPAALLCAALMDGVLFDVRH